MLNLQEKAHFSIDEFRRGKGAPLSRSPTSPTTPDGDDDELSVLGGRTRLVSKKEPSSPILMERSPISQNPVVPLPLSPGMQNQLQPSVLEYLKSFAPSQNGQQTYPVQSTSSQGSYASNASNNNASSHSPYSDDVSPVSMYGMSTMSTPYQPEPSYLPPHSQPSMQSVMHQQSNGMVSQPETLNQKASGQDFPTYFPVYDYGLPATNYTATSSNSYGNGDSMLMVDTGSASNVSRRVSGSPDSNSNMQATWLDFVNTMAMQT